MTTSQELCGQGNQTHTFQAESQQASHLTKQAADRSRKYCIIL